MTHLMVPVLAAPLMDPERMRITLEVPAGLTVAEIVRIALPGAGVGPGQLRVTLVSDMGAAVIPRRLWERVRPNPGVQVVIRAVPGDDQTVRTVLLVAVSAAALIFAPAIAGAIGLAGLGALGVGLVAAGLTVIGTLLVNALIPPPTPDDDPVRNVYEISALRNNLRPGQPVPLILGRHRYAPPFAAPSYTEIVGDDQYVRALFCVGYGPVRISDLRIGDTPIDDYDDIDVEIREGRSDDAPVTIYDRQVFEETFGIELTRPSANADKPASAIEAIRDALGGASGGSDTATILTPLVRWSGLNVTEISVLLGFPGGLFRVNDDGNVRSTSVSIRIRARRDGVGDWINVQTLKVTAAKRESFVRQFTWSVPQRGRYQIEVTRLTPDNQSTQRSSRSYLVALQSIRPEYPINMNKPLGLIAIRVKASGQLNGALDTVNCIAEREGLTRAGDLWVAGYSRTPASAFLTALMGSSNPYPVAEAEIDMDLIADWHAWCLSKNLKYDRVHDRSESLAEMLALICAAGRATPRHDGLRWGVVIDRPQELVVDHINPRNSTDFAWSRTYFEPPDGMRVRFLDETDGYQEAERIVPWPGHVGPVNLTEAIDLPGKTDPDEVWREAKRRMYELIHRPDQFSAIQDGASRVVTRGDQVMGSFDVLERSQRAARVQAVTGSAVEIDESVTIGEGWGVRFRVYADPDDVIGSSLVRPLAPSNGETRLLRINGSGPLPSVGDLVHVGPLQTESIALRLRGIEPGQDLTSRLLMVSAAPIIDELTDAEVPPAWDGSVGEVSPPVTSVPQPPIFVRIAVGTIAGAAANTVQILLRASGATTAVTDRFELDHRLDGTSVWTTRSFPVSDGGVAFDDYALIDRIEIRARAFAGVDVSDYTDVFDFDLQANLIIPAPSVATDDMTVTDQGGSALIEIFSTANTAIVGFVIYRTPPGVAVDREVHDISNELPSTPNNTISYTDVVAPGSYDYWVSAVNDVGRRGALAGPVQITVTAAP